MSVKNVIFSLYRKEDRDILVNIAVTIYLYAREHNLPFIQCVRETGDCFLDIHKKPDNNMAKNHEGFIANLFVIAARDLVKSARHHNSVVYREIGRSLKRTPEDYLIFMASLLDTLQSANEAEKQEIFTQMESQINNSGKNLVIRRSNP